MKIVVTGYLIRKPVAGLSWHYGQYLVGLQRLGHDVLYIEDSEDANGEIDACLSYAQLAFSHLGLEDSWAFYDFHMACWRGPHAKRMNTAVRDADVLISVSGALAIMDRLQRIPVRIFVDTDPVFTQSKTSGLPVWSDRCLAHTAHFSFGENAHGRTDGALYDGIHWQATRQPIALDLWSGSAPRSDAFTTIMSWKSYDAVESSQGHYGLKSDTFSTIESLPQETDAHLEIALDAPRHVADALAALGWKIAPASRISASAAAYRDYIQASCGELTIAKEAYVVSRCGWFSERSACYLASGRPVITQSTGFETFLPAGHGLLSFRTGDEALAALESVRSNYQSHAAAAREIAEAFDTAEVLQSLLTRAVVTNPEVAAENSPVLVCRERYQATIGRIAAVIPDGATFLLIDNRNFGLFGHLGRRKVLPFLERDGQYWGAPESSRQAIDELERLRTLGASHVVILGGCYWWKDYYKEFWVHMCAEGHFTHRDDDLTIVALGSTGSAAASAVESVSAT